MALSLPFHLGPRMRRVLRYVGFVVLALVTFVFALQLTFPYGRVKDKIVEALSAKYEVTIGGVERGIVPGRMFFKAVTLRSRPDSADEVATTFYIEKLEVDLGLLALIRGVASVDIDAKIGAGHISGNISLSKTRTSIDLEGDNLPSASLPMREGIGLPMSGKVSFSVELELPSEKSKTGKVAPNWQKATGAMAIDCATGCTFGDGKAKIRPKLTNARQQAFAADGIEFGKLNVDKLSARVTIKDGLLTVTRFEVESPDIEVHVDLELALAPSINESTVAGCLRFKGSQALLKREPKTHAALSTTGADLREDGLFHIKLEGDFKKMKRRNAQCGPTPNGNMDDPSARPNLTVQPADDTLTKPATTPPPPPPPTIASPPPADAAEAPANGASGSGGHGSGDATGAPNPGHETPPGEPVPEGEGEGGKDGKEEPADSHNRGGG